MARSLARTGEVDRIDLFVLSDTRDEAIWREEERAYDVLLAETRGKAGMPQVFYRRRLDNTGRKAGNLADFCTNWGHHYDFMVVLDADSLMSGDTIRRMIRLMEDNGRIGLIQTVSHPVNRETLFARIHQFAANLYTPLSVLGLTSGARRTPTTGATTRSSGSRPSWPIATCRCCRARRRWAARSCATTSSRPA